MTLKSKIKEFIVTFAFNEIHELNKNNDIIRKSRFISFVIIEIKSLHQFDAEVVSAEVNIKVNVEKVNKENYSSLLYCLCKLT
jgi:delta 1-pyrroline-5-carboxylate dehydrogenase